MILLYSNAEKPNLPQQDPHKSLGGNISGSLVGSNMFGNLFGEISKWSRENGAIETKAIVLKNTTGNTVTGVTLYQQYPNSGYTAATITITGDGTGATATAVIVSGVITAINLVSPGSAYTYANVSISGDGWGAYATATVDPNTNLITAINIAPGTLCKIEWAAVSLVNNEKMELIPNMRATPTVGTFYEPNQLTGAITLVSSLPNNGTIGLWVRRTILTVPNDPLNVVQDQNLQAYLASLNNQENINVVISYN